MGFQVTDEKKPLQHYFLACMINVICFTLLRAVLYAISWGVMDHSLSNAMSVFGLGFLYDMIFNIYFSIFFAVFLLVIPNKAYNQQGLQRARPFIFFRLSLRPLFHHGCGVAFLG